MVLDESGLMMRGDDLLSVIRKIFVKIKILFSGKIGKIIACYR
jgi:hypothetical protein